MLEATVTKRRKAIRSFVDRQLTKAATIDIDAEYRSKLRGPPSLIPNEKTLSITQRNRETSGLLRLPAEVRNEIYKLALDLEDHHLHTDHISWDRLDLSRASHQLFTETAPFYYWMKLMPLVNRIRTLYDFYIVNHVLELLTPSQIRVVNEVTLSWDFLHQAFGSNRGLRHLKGLGKVVVLDAPGRVTRRNVDLMNFLAVGYREQGLGGVVFELVVR